MRRVYGDEIRKVLEAGGELIIGLHDVGYDWFMDGGIVQYRDGDDTHIYGNGRLSYLLEEVDEEGLLVSKEPPPPEPAKDLLTSNERDLVETLRSLEPVSYDLSPQKLLALIDRLAPKPAPVEKWRKCTPGEALDAYLAGKAIRVDGEHTFSKQNGAVCKVEFSFAYDYTFEILEG